MEGGTISGEVFEICANIDDMTGEDLGAAMEILLGEGALDVWFEAIQMKKTVLPSNCRCWPPPATRHGSRRRCCAILLRSACV